MVRQWLAERTPSGPYGDNLVERMIGQIATVPKDPSKVAICTAGVNEQENLLDSRATIAAARQTFQTNGAEA